MVTKLNLFLISAIRVHEGSADNDKRLQGNKIHEIARQEAPFVVQFDA